MKRLACVVLAVALFGCATAPLSLKPDTTGKIQNIAIVTSPIKDEFMVLNHLIGTDFGDTLYISSGTAGYLFGSLLDWAIKTDQKQTSLGGNPKVLKENLGLIPVKKHIDDSLTEQMSKRFHIAESSYFEKMQQGSTDKDKKVDEYIAHCKDIGADTLLMVDFFYGLAVYSGDMASVAIDASIAVYDVKKGKKLLKKIINSDLYFKEGHSVDEYASDDAKLFKENIIKAARGLSLLIGYEFGIDVEYVDKTKTVLPINTLHVSCEKPYLLEQDCSLLKRTRRKIKINDYRCKIAGSHDGTVILTMTKVTPSEATEEEEQRSSASDRLTKKNNTCLELISNELSKHNINILKKVEVQDNVFSYPATAGYFLELDGDGYSILKQYTK